MAHARPIRSLDPASPAATALAEGRYVIRRMTLDDFRRTARPWMAEAGWDPGLDDGPSFLAADPAGFLIGELDGVPVATVSGVRYDDSFAFLGCYLVAASYRGAGYGLAIHEAARARLAGCLQGGDAVPERVATYARIGRIPAYSNRRFAGIPVRPAARDRRLAAHLVDAADLPLLDLAAYDRTCFPGPRPGFLDTWVRQPGAHARAIVSRGRIGGFGVVRPAEAGWRVGPLFADDAATARTILLALVDTVPSRASVAIDVPEPNGPAIALAAELGLPQVFETVRTYTGPAPSIRLDRVYGVTTLELG
ncbi:MAG: hypothetical protein RL338_224 [Chloroflexota bacterium]